MPDQPVGPSGWITGAVAVIVFVFITPTGMWLPLERLTYTNGKQSMVYVLDDSQGWMTTIDRSHAIKTFRTATIRSRAVCDQGTYESLATLAMNVHSKEDKCD